MAIAPGGFAAHNVIRLIVFYAYSTVPDPDLEIRRGGGRSSRPLDKGEGQSPTKFFRSFAPQFGLKIRGGGGPRLDPPLPSPK